MDGYRYFQRKKETGIRERFFREVAFKMEKAGKAGDMSAAKAHMSELETQFGRLKAAMEKEM